jgi:antitoxin VapB
MQVRRPVKLFKQGREQVVRIPSEFELPGQDAIIHRDGDKLVIEAAPPRSLLAVLAALDPIEDALPEICDTPPGAVDL